MFLISFSVVSTHTTSQILVLAGFPSAFADSNHQDFPNDVMDSFSHQFSKMVARVLFLVSFSRWLHADSFSIEFSAFSWLRFLIQHFDQWNNRVRLRQQLFTQCETCLVYKLKVSFLFNKEHTQTHTHTNNDRRKMSKTEITSFFALKLPRNKERFKDRLPCFVLNFQQPWPGSEHLFPWTPHSHSSYSCRSPLRGCSAPSFLRETGGILKTCT